MEKIKPEIEEKLKQMDFKESNEKPGLWAKPIECGFAHWDFRKSIKGRFFVSIDGGGFEDTEAAKLRPEYVVIRGSDNASEAAKTPIKAEIVQHPMQGVQDRGNEAQIYSVVKSRNLELIARVASDKLGEGILYHDLGKQLGMEPSAELIDMISCAMGNIKTEVTSLEMHEHYWEETGDVFRTYAAVVKAEDLETGTTGIGAAEEVIDYKEMKTSGRSFAMTKAIRKAERNAKERLIGVPRKALVELTIELIRKQKGKK